VLQWAWSELDLGIAPEMATGKASGLELVMELDNVLGMVNETVLELEMALGTPSESKLIDWAGLFRGDPRCLMGSFSLLFTVLLELDMIAILGEC
jgi:hypothetical protein